MYQNYVFDLYGTLVDIRTDESGEKFWGEVADIYGGYGATYTPLEIESEYMRLAKVEKKKEHFRHLFTRHIEINLEHVFENLYQSKGVTPTDEMIKDTAIRFRKASTIFIELYDGVVDLLQSLKKAGKNVYLLSNAQRCFTYPEIVELGIADYFDDIFISSDYSCSKPDVKFFKELIKAHNLSRKDTIMIGNDCISDMLVAKGVGVDSLYIHQEISTPLEGHTLYCNYKIMDGDVTKIKDCVLKAQVQ